MGKRSTLFALPPEVQAEVLRRAAESQLGGYSALEAWLRSKGHEIGKSSLHRALAPYEPELTLVRRARFLQTVAGESVTLKDALQIVALEDVAKSLDYLIKMRAPA